ncbi:MAG: hypothetical protein C5B51_24285 [Terriglobia bacterium]|nr:MAG: hypothetical protein C5B51_24285 [Terriglobia bacterium]
MKKVVTLFVCLCALTAYAADVADVVGRYAGGRGGGLTPITITYQSYNPADGQNDLTQNIDYYLPNSSKFGNGPYPVFMYIPATYEPYNSPLSLIFINQMLARGFMSASVQYMNTESQQNCTEYTARAQGIFDATRATSAVGALCSISKANCSKGIVDTGISQGAELVILSANYAPQVKAVFALSGGDNFINVAPLPGTLPCEDKANTRIPSNRLTLIDGQSDPYFGGQSNVQGPTGLTCAPGTFQCWSPDGSGAGWYIVQNSQNLVNMAGHCYFFDGNPPSPYACTGTPDPSWFTPATNNWSLAPNMDWLASFGTHRNFSPNGQ